MSFPLYFFDLDLFGPVDGNGLTRPCIIQSNEISFSFTFRSVVLADELRAGETTYTDRVCENALRAADRIRAGRRRSSTPCVGVASLFA